MNDIIRAIQFEAAAREIERRRMPTVRVRYIGGPSDGTERAIPAADLRDVDVVEEPQPTVSINDGVLAVVKMPKLHAYHLRRWVNEAHEVELRYVHESLPEAQP